MDRCEWHAVRAGLRIGLRVQAGCAQNIGSVAVWPFPVSGPILLESRCVAPPVSQHVPVLLQEVVAWLQPSPDAILVDGTLGGGGHARVLAEKIQGRGRILGIDRDPAVAELATERLAGLPIEPIVANYCDLPEILAACAIPAVDGILLDLGLSSDQLADPTRGFGFHSNGPLDLRFDPTRGERNDKGLALCQR